MDEANFWNYIESFNWPNTLPEEARKQAMLEKSPKEAEEYYQIARERALYITALLTSNNIYSLASSVIIGWNLVGKGQYIYNKYSKDINNIPIEYLTEDEESFKEAIPSEDNYYSY